MKILSFALFLLAAGAIMFVLDLLIRKTAYSIDRRYLHARNIIAVLVVELVGANVFTVSFPMLLIDGIVNSEQVAPALNAILPARAYELLYLLLVLLGLNILILLAILIATFAVRKIFRNEDYLSPDDLYGAGKILHASSLIAARYYEEDDNGGAMLRGRGVIAHIWAEGMKWSFLILWIVEILALAGSILWGGEAWNQTLRSIGKAWYLLPMAGYELVQQFSLMLEGEIIYDEAGSFGSAEIGKRLVGELGALAEAYHKIFQDSGALLYCEAGSSDAPQKDGLGSNDLDNTQVNDCAQGDVLKLLHHQLRDIGVQKKHAYQDALAELLRGGSVNIRDQADGEFFIYLCAYLNFYLSQGKTALVLCRSEESAERIRAHLVDTLSRLNTLYSIWDIRSGRTAVSGERMNVLVCSAQELASLHLTERHGEFVSDLFCTAILDAFALFSQDEFHVAEVFNELRAVGHPLQYVLVSSEDNENLRIAAENAIKLPSGERDAGSGQLIPFNSDVRQPNTFLMVWKEESGCRLQRFVGVGNSISPYLGTALPLSLVAVHYDLPRVYLLSDPERCDESFRNALTMAGREVAEYLGRNVDLNSIIRTEPREFMENRDLCVAVAYDTDYNMFNTLWRWMKYGGDDGMLLHVVSPPYLLRDFFAANFSSKRLLMKNHEFDALLPGSLGLDTSRKAAILVEMCGEGMTKEALMERSRSYGWRYENEEKLLEDCLLAVMRREEIHSIYESFRFGHKLIRASENIRGRLMEIAAFGEMVSNNQSVRIPVLSGNLHNYYLRGQAAVFNGYLYRIAGVKDGIVYAERETPQEIPQYYPVSQFSFKDFKQIDHCVDTRYVDMDLCRARVDRSIFGYWSCTMGNDFVSGGALFNSLINDEDVAASDRVENASILEISFPRAEFGEHSEQAAMLAAFLLDELAKTLFPSTWQNLFVVTDSRPDDTLTGRLLERGESCTIEEKIRSVIPWVKESDEKASAKDPQLVTIYAVEFSCVEYGMAQMLYKNRERIFRILWEYLRWYLGEAGEEEKPLAAQGSYLNFGAEEIPSVFAPKELLALLEKLAPVAPDGGEGGHGEKEADKICTFCGKPAIFAFQLEDGRCMCRDCDNHQLSRKAEIREMFGETFQFMQQRYAIKLRRNIHVRFQSADAIRKAAGGGYNGRVLGFYASRSHQLWLEARGPRVAMQGTLFHELTHAWQFDRLDLKRLKQSLPKEEADALLLELMEGHAMYVEVDAMRRQNENDYAERIHKDTMRRDDEYGKGYRLLYDYIREKEAGGSHMNAFTAMEALVRDLIEGRAHI